MGKTGTYQITKRRGKLHFQEESFINEEADMLELNEKCLVLF